MCCYLVHLEKEYRYKPKISIPIYYCMNELRHCEYILYNVKHKRFSDSTGMLSKTDKIKL